MVRVLRFTLLAGVLLATGSLPAQEAGRGHVAALGRLEPGDGVIDLAAAREERIARLEVQEGDLVPAGTPVAYLESHAERRADVDAARARLRGAEQRLLRIQQVRPLEVEALEADLRRLQAALAVEESDLRRFASLRERDLIPEQDHERQTSVVRRASEELQHAEARLHSDRASLEVERHEAEADVAEAVAALAAAEARLERAVVRAPVSGQVIKIFTWPGEAVGDDPLLRLGEVARMYAVAEVYETDVRFVRIGQAAVVTSPALPGPLRGTVERVGLMVHKNDVLGIDPAAATDARIVEVRVRLEDSTVPARFIQLQVDVSIDVGDPE